MSLKEITVPEGVHTVGDHAFSGCINLWNVILPSGLKDIQTEAFRGTTIREISIPDSVTHIGKKAFYKCEKLDMVKITDKSKLEKIESEAFHGCKLLKEVKIVYVC